MRVTFEQDRAQIWVTDMDVVPRSGDWVSVNPDDAASMVAEVLFLVGGPAAPHAIVRLR